MGSGLGHAQRATMQAVEVRTASIQEADPEDNPVESDARRRVESRQSDPHRKSARLSGQVETSQNPSASIAYGRTLGVVQEFAVREGPNIHVTDARQTRARHGHTAIA